MDNVNRGEVLTTRGSPTDRHLGYSASDQFQSCTEIYRQWAVISIAIAFPRDRLCGLVVRVLDYRSGGMGSIPGTTRKKSSGSGTGSTQPREYN
jgi:hypothetical protein